MAIGAVLVNINAFLTPADMECELTFCGRNAASGDSNSPNAFGLIWCGDPLGNRTIRLPRSRPTCAGLLLPAPLTLFNPLRLPDCILDGKSTVLVCDGERYEKLRTLPGLKNMPFIVCRREGRALAGPSAEFEKLVAEYKGKLEIPTYPIASEDNCIIFFTRCGSSCAGFSFLGCLIPPSPSQWQWNDRQAEGRSPHATLVHWRHPIRPLRRLQRPAPPRLRPGLAALAQL